jgi:ATP-dependent DNA ligase
MMQENFSVRFDWLRARIKPVESNKIKLAPTLTASLESLDEALKGAVEDGYEGVILRLDNSPYQAGKRSKAVIKVKQFYDDEFLVVDITPSTEGHAILHCVTKDGAKFKCSAPGNHMQRAETFENKDEYLGRYVQIKYQEFSKDKKPIPPVAMRWRDPSED